MERYGVVRGRGKSEGGREHSFIDIYLHGEAHRFTDTP